MDKLINHNASCRKTLATLDLSIILWKEEFFIVSLQNDTFTEYFMESDVSTGWSPNQIINSQTLHTAFLLQWTFHCEVETAVSVSNSVYPADKTGERDMGCRQLRDETESID